MGLKTVTLQWVSNWPSLGELLSSLNIEDQGLMGRAGSTRTLSRFPIYFANCSDRSMSRGSKFVCVAFSLSMISLWGTKLPKTLSEPDTYFRVQNEASSSPPALLNLGPHFYSETI